MLKIGNYNELIVEGLSEHGAYLNEKPDQVLLPSKYMPANTKQGDTLKVFVYHDSEGRPVATTLTPKAVVGEFAYLQVKSVVSFGAFVDWGLEKDLLVPGNEQHERMMVGQKYVVKVCLDKLSGRVYATNRITRSCDTQVGGLRAGQKVDILIYDVTKLGFMSVIDNRYSGMLYKDETYRALTVGDRSEAFIGRIREDGRIDLTLKRPGYQSIADSSRIILAALEQQGGFIPCHDNSSPEEIRRTFAISKKEFKRAIGGLYKAGTIEILDHGIRLKRQE